MRLLQLAARLRFEPIQIIEWVIAFFTLVAGVYLFTPFYEISRAQNGPGPVAQALGGEYLILLWGALLLVGALFVMLGLWKGSPQFKSIGWFTIFMGRLFQIISTLLLQGLLPIVWIYPLTLMFVATVLYFTARWRVKHAAR